MIDLHIHTINSDGDYSTKEILEEAENKGLSIISISDHNNVNSYKDIKEQNLQNTFSGKIVIGTELEFCYNGRLFDMLGYDFDLEQIKNSDIMIKGMQHTTVERENEILQKLEKIADTLGIKYSNNLKAESTHYMANDIFLDDIIKYPENKEKLDNLKIYDRGSFYRKHFCEPSSPFYMINTSNKFSLEYVCNLIHSCGGKTFFAHCFHYGIEDVEGMLDYLRENHYIDGIECYHRKHSKEQIEFLINYCDKYNLLKSGGSDKHTSSHEIGHANNNKIEIPEELVKDWVNETNKQLQIKKGN